MGAVILLFNEGGYILIISPYYYKVDAEEGGATNLEGGVFDKEGRVYLLPSFIVFFGF